MKTFKKMILFTMALLVSSVVFASGKPEGLPKSLVVLHEGAGDYMTAFEDFTQETGVSVDLILADYSDGSNKSMPPILKAGERVDIYSAYIGRAGTYMVPVDNKVWTSIDLTDYPEEIELEKFGNLEMYTRRGKVLAVPMPGGYQALAVNLDMLVAIGAEDFDFEQWTIEDFLDFGRRVKSKWGGDKWLTALFAGNRSGDYLVRHWFAAFGAKFFEDGDYSKTVIGSPEAANTLRMFKDLHKQGMVNPDAATSIDDEYVLYWTRGEILFATYFPAWNEHYFTTLEKQDPDFKRFEMKFVSLPSVDGKPVPVVGSTGVVIGAKSGNPEQDRLIAKLIGMMTGKKVQDAIIAARPAVAPSRKDVAGGGDPWTEQVGAIMLEAGVFDLGAALPTYTEQRGVLPKYLQELFAGTMEPEDIIREYTKEMNEILARPVALY